MKFRGKKCNYTIAKVQTGTIIFPIYLQLNGQMLLNGQWLVVGAGGTGIVVPVISSLFWLGIHNTTISVVAWLHVSSPPVPSRKWNSLHMVHIIGCKYTLAHSFYTHHLPHLTSRTCTQTCMCTHRHHSFTDSAVSSSKDDWACDSFSHCCVDTEGEGERVKRMIDDKRDGCFFWFWFFF